jgi:hypothetical protein
MGYGDYLMLVGKARYIRSVTQKNIKFTSRESESSRYYQEVIFNNPYMILEKNNDNKIPVINIARNFLFTLNLKGEKVYLPPTPGEIFLTDKERSKVNSVASHINEIAKGRPKIFVNFNVKRSERVNGTIEDYPNYINRQPSKLFINRLIREIKEDCLIIKSTFEDNVSEDECYVLPSVTFRELVGLCGFFDAYLGTEGGSHHAAAAANLRGVVLMGAWAPPDRVGYALHYNLAIGKVSEIAATNDKFIRSLSSFCIAAINSFDVRTIKDLIDTVIAGHQE